MLAVEGLPLSSPYIPLPLEEKDCDPLSLWEAIDHQDKPR
jgi:hypothetical protein